MFRSCRQCSAVRESSCRGEPGYAHYLAELSARPSMSGEGSSRPSTSGTSRASAVGELSAEMEAEIDNMVEQ